MIGVFVLAVLILLWPRHAPSYTASPTPTPDRDTYTVAAEELIRQKLRDPGSAEFNVLKVSPSDPSHSAIVCGTVNARNGFGGMSGGQRFVVGGTVALEDEIGAADMDQIWRQFCG